MSANRAKPKSILTNFVKKLYNILNVLHYIFRIAAIAMLSAGSMTAWASAFSTRIASSRLYSLITIAIPILLPLSGRYLPFHTLVEHVWLQEGQGEWSPVLRAPDVSARWAPSCLNYLKETLEKIIDWVLYCRERTIRSGCWWSGAVASPQIEAEEASETSAVQGGGDRRGVEQGGEQVEPSQHNEQEPGDNIPAIRQQRQILDLRKLVIEIE